MHLSMSEDKENSNHHRLRRSQTKMDYLCAPGTRYKSQNKHRRSLTNIDINSLNISQTSKLNVMFAQCNSTPSMIIKDKKRTNNHSKSPRSKPKIKRRRRTKSAVPSFNISDDNCLQRQIYEVGDRVVMKKYGEGIIRYKGLLQGKNGIYYGVEARIGCGKHNGAYDGCQYFECPNGAGIFVQNRHIVGFAKNQNWAKKVASLNQSICALKTKNASLHQEIDKMDLMRKQFEKKEKENEMLIRFILDQQEKFEKMAIDNAGSEESIDSEMESIKRSESISSMDELSDKWSEKVSVLEKDNEDLKRRLVVYEERQCEMQKTMSDQRLMYEELLKNAMNDGSSCDNCTGLKQTIGDKEKEMTKLRFCSKQNIDTCAKLKKQIEGLMKDFKMKMDKVTKEKVQFAENNYQIRRENKRLQEQLRILRRSKIWRGGRSRQSPVINEENEEPA